MLIFEYSILSYLECTWCVVENSQNEEEFRDFLEILCRAQCFLHVSACFGEAKGFMMSSLMLLLGLTYFKQYL